MPESSTEGTIGFKSISCSFTVLALAVTQRRAHHQIIRQTSQGGAFYKLSYEAICSHNQIVLAIDYANLCNIL